MAAAEDLVEESAPELSAPEQQDKDFREGLVRMAALTLQAAAAGPGEPVVVAPVVLDYLVLLPGLQLREEEAAAAAAIRADLADPAVAGQAVQGLQLHPREQPTPVAVAVAMVVAELPVVADPELL